MTVCLAGKNHRTHTGYTPLFVIDPSKDRLLQYEQIRSQGQERSIGLDPELLASPELDVRTDLGDMGIDICSPDGKPRSRMCLIISLLVN